MMAISFSGPAMAEQRNGAAVAAPANEQRLLDNWLTIQGINLNRHANSLRPFTQNEFGTGPAAPGEAHIKAVNRFIDSLRINLDEMTRWVSAATEAARREPTTARLQTLLERKQAASDRVLYVEGVWDFYFDLFVQRLSSFGERLLTVDRITANCYEDLYISIGTAQPTPSLLPFSYANSGFSPSTYRRGVPLMRLRYNKNLFPLIMLPQHRLDNVWALSSVLHEVSHNLQADLGLWDEMPGHIYRRLITEGRITPTVAQIWARWHKEMMADMFALLLGGPAAVESLMDVVGRAPASTVKFNPQGVHPTPYLRVLISLILLRRMGFEKMAENMRRVWQRLYPRVAPDDIPRPVMETFTRASELAVDTMVFQPYRQFANKSLSQVLKFGPREMQIIEQAGRQLAERQPLGAVPARFMIGAARFALDNHLATPQAITDNFYRTLGRR
ncbi:MAG TPA: hypothetical protein VFN23_00170 [Ktedonobacteraceae bacterium]|nr:hypothetical protein [Ktedonobacteraceae bacterium]